MSKPGWHERKHHADRIYRKRIKRIGIHRWWHFFNSNGDQYNIDWTSLILHNSYIYLKNTSTTNFDTRHKSKYSPNKGYCWRDWHPRTETFGLRGKDKVNIRRGLKKLKTGEIDEFIWEINR
jgi:hypothetical protein